MARATAAATKRCTTSPRRKRISRLAGCTFTSTCSGGTVSNSAPAG